MAYLGLAIGSILGLFVVYFGSDRISKAMEKKHGRKSAEVPFPVNVYLISVSSRPFRLATIFDAYWLVNVRVGSPIQNALVRYLFSPSDPRSIPIMGTFIFGFGAAIIFVSLSSIFR